LQSSFYTTALTNFDKFVHMYRIVGVLGGVGCAANGLRQSGQVIMLVVLVSDAVISAAAGFPVLYRTVQKIVIVRGGDAGFGIRHRCQVAVVIIGVGDGIAILKSLKGQSARITDGGRLSLHLFSHLKAIL